MNFRILYFLGMLYLFFYALPIATAGEIPKSLKSYLQSFDKANKEKYEDRWFGPDKGYHAMGSMISTTLIGQISLKGSGYSLKKSRMIGAGTTFTFGIIKEIYDSRQPHNHFSWKDLAADGVGIIVGIIILGIQ